jgi:hypothetical protein
MAEEKIIKHSGNAARALLKTERTWKQKLGEFLFEIFIIVIAVSITLWFHNWNDHLHEKRLARDFLTGIRSDLKITADNLEVYRKSYQHTLDYYDTIWTQMATERVNKRFMDSASGNLVNMLGFTFDNSRYESFKSAGYLRLIEDQPLLQDITRMFAVTLPDRAVSDQVIFQERRSQYIQYIGTKTPMGPAGNSLISGFINDQAIRFQIRWQRMLLDEMRDQKMTLRNEINKLVQEIDNELGR